jgi:DNA-binding GntR family transcriptional regulator
MVYPITSHSHAVQRVIDHLLSALRNGHLAPGQRVIEAALCNELGSGRVPVREAIHILAGDGVLSVEANRGASILKFSCDDLSQMLVVLGALQQTGVAAALERNTGQFIARVRDAFNEARTQARADSWPSFLLALDKVHDAINDAGFNLHLNRTIKRLQPALIYLNLGPWLYGHPTDFHVAAYMDMVSAIADRNQVKALRCYQAHIQNIRSRLTAKAIMKRSSNGR